MRQVLIAMATWLAVLGSPCASALSPDEPQPPAAPPSAAMAGDEDPDAPLPPTTPPGPPDPATSPPAAAPAGDEEIDAPLPPDEAPPVAAPPIVTPLAQLPPAYQHEEAKDQSGRTALVIGDTLLWGGLGFSVPLLFDSAEETTILMSGMAGFALAGGTSFVLSEDAEVTSGYATTHLASQVWGLTTGLGLYALAVDGDVESRGVVLSMLGGAGTCLALSLVFKDAFSLSQAKAEQVLGAWYWGSYLGALMPFMLSGDMDDLTWQAFVASTIITSSAAATLTLLLAPDWSLARVRAINLIGVGGLLLGSTLMGATIEYTPRLPVGIGMGTVVVALALGVLLTDDMDRPKTTATAPLPGLVTYDGQWRVGLPSVEVTPWYQGETRGYDVLVGFAAGVF